MDPFWNFGSICSDFPIVCVVCREICSIRSLETHYTDLLKAPCKQYLLGTDQMGRDIFSRILYGGKTSLLIAFAVTAIISVVGILVGTAAGFWGGAFDAVLMRLSDMLMAFPGSIFTIALVSFLGTGLPNLILAMTLTGWTYYARISRSLVLSIKNNTYIEQARLAEPTISAL